MEIFPTLLYNINTVKPLNRKLNREERVKMVSLFYNHMYYSEVLIIKNKEESSL